MILAGADPRRIICQASHSPRLARQHPALRNSVHRLHVLPVRGAPGSRRGGSVSAQHLPRRVPRAPRSDADRGVPSLPARRAGLDVGWSSGPFPAYPARPSHLGLDPGVGGVAHPLDADLPVQRRDPERLRRGPLLRPAGRVYHLHERLDGREDPDFRAAVHLGESLATRLESDSSSRGRAKYPPTRSPFPAPRSCSAVASRPQSPSTTGSTPRRRSTGTASSSRASTTAWPDGAGRPQGSRPRSRPGTPSWRASRRPGPEPSSITRMPASSGNYRSGCLGR